MVPSVQTKVRDSDFHFTLPFCLDRFVCRFTAGPRPHTQPFSFLTNSRYLQPGFRLLVQSKERAVLREQHPVLALQLGQLTLLFIVLVLWRQVLWLIDVQVLVLGRGRGGRLRSCDGSGGG